MKANAAELIEPVEMSTLKIPRYPRSWYRHGASAELKTGAATLVSRSEIGREFIAYRCKDGTAAIMDGRCSHLGAKLKHGEIVDDKVRCPLHGWCYARSGECVEIPAGDEIPDFAGQTAYPIVERFGELFYFLGPEPSFEFPSFAGVDPESLYPARTFGLELGAPWYMITGNGFDMQHFRQSHDRTLLSEPEVSHPAPDAIKVVMRLGVDGDCLRDSLIRRFAGPELTFNYTCWGGNLGFIQAQFERTTSYGFVAVTPLTSETAWYSNTVFVSRRRGLLSKAINIVNAEIRRLMIYQFLKVDIHRIEGTFGAAQRCIGSDKTFLQFLNWVQRFN